MRVWRTRFDGDFLSGLRDPPPNALRILWLYNVYEPRGYFTNYANTGSATARFD